MAACGAESIEMGAVCNKPAGHEGDHIEHAGPAEDGSPSFASWENHDNDGPPNDDWIHRAYYNQAPVNPLFKDRRADGTRQKVGP